MMTLEDYLEASARRYPEKTALVCAGEQFSYKDLWQRVLAYTADCAEYHRGQIVCLRASSTVDFVVAYFSLHRLGCVVVPLEQSMPDAAFRQLSAEMSAHVVPEGTADILYTTGTTGRSKGVIVSHSTIIADAENLIDGQLHARDGVCHQRPPEPHREPLQDLPRRDAWRNDYSCRRAEGH